MVDLSEFETANAGSPQRLKVDRILDDLDKDQESKLLAALSNPKYTSASISRVLNAWGHAISPDAVQRWRKTNS